MTQGERYCKSVTVQATNTVGEWRYSSSHS